MRVNENKNNVMKCSRVVGGRSMNVALDGELLEEVECFKYLGSKITTDGGIETEVKSRINNVGKVLGGMKVFSCKAMGMYVYRGSYRCFFLAVPVAY